MAKIPEVYLGVDPGASGGLAALWPGKTVVSPMPDLENELWEWLSRYSARNGVIHGFCCTAILEKVGGYIPGSRGNIGSAMFKFGQFYGTLRGMLVAADIPFVEVAPTRWQNYFYLKSRPSESKPQFKRRLKEKAQEIFPGLKVTLATADALLIAEYYRRKWGEKS